MDFLKDNIYETLLPLLLRIIDCEIKIIFEITSRGFHHSLIARDGTRQKSPQISQNEKKTIFN